MHGQEVVKEELAIVMWIAGTGTEMLAGAACSERRKGRISWAGVAQQDLVLQVLMMVASLPRGESRRCRC